MKKHGYCCRCDYDFDYVVNTMSDLECICPKCGSKCSNHKVLKPTKLEKNVGRVADGILDFYFNFYLIFSLVGIISYFFKFNKLLIISTLLMVVLYLIELLIGYTRNVFGFLGFVISIIIGIFINNICLCITIMFLISSFIRLLYKLFFKFLVKKYG